jgi:membrane-associated phospholipid phosphatase
MASPAATRQRLARLVSIVAHPAVVMAIAAAVAGGAGDDASGLRWQSLGFTLAAVAAVMLYSVWQARSGRWAHIDASQRHERSQLNRFASWLLLGLAALLALAGTQPGIVAAIGLAGLVILAGHLLRGRLKSSLHVAFAVFAAGLVWPHPLACAGLLLAAAVVGWSRVALGRHALSEVLVGAVLGALAGAAFQLLAHASAFA